MASPDLRVSGGNPAGGGEFCCQPIRLALALPDPASSKTEKRMPPVFETAPAASAIPITFANRTTWDAVSAGLSAPGRQFALANGFVAKPGKCLILPSPDGQIAQVIFGLEDESSKSRDPFRAGSLPGLLPAGVYRFANAPHDSRLAA